MSEILYIAAKAPRAGFVKTRLAAAIGEPEAAILYGAFLHDLAARFARAKFPVGWYVTPADAWRELEPLVGGPGRVSPVLVQDHGTWTERQRELFRRAPARGEERIVLVSSDSPQLRVETVDAAFRGLETSDIVIGPTHDGGYYLLGMRGWHDVLDGVAMSTPTVVEEILGRARAGGLSATTLEATFDVDEHRDLTPLASLARSRPDLEATWAVLESLGEVPLQVAS